MTPAPPTLDQLALLVAIADEGTFAGAARRLHRVPSAVSYGVKGLEESLGVTLFDRSGHRAAWTDAGQRILEEARGVLARVDHLQRLAASLGDGWEPTLDLVVDGSLPMAPVTAALTRLTAADPPTRVQVHVEYQSGVQARFANSGAALMLPVEIDLDAGLHARPLAPLLMVVWWPRATRSLRGAVCRTTGSPPRAVRSTARTSGLTSSSW
jgi:DNA-binding transcriptional LysR family regulator